MLRLRPVPKSVLDAYDETPEEVTLTGPRRLLRGAGVDNNPYGQWWFDEGELLSIQSGFDRIPLPASHRREAILGRLRSNLAISIDWNTLSQWWLMQIPAGPSVPALVGTIKSQPVFSVAHRLHNPSRSLSGRLRQYWIPVKNPLWVARYGEVSG